MRLAPGDPVPPAFPGITYVIAGKYELANTTFAELPGGFRDKQAWIAYGLAASGDKQGAEKKLAELKTEPWPATSHWALAAIYTRLGRTGQALDELEKAHEQHFLLINSLKVEPLFAPLRPEERFQNLIRAIHLD